MDDANGRYDLEKKGDSILMSKIVEDTSERGQKLIAPFPFTTQLPTMQIPTKASFGGNCLIGIPICGQRDGQRDEHSISLTRDNKRVKSGCVSADTDIRIQIVLTYAYWSTKQKH